MIQSLHRMFLFSDDMRIISAIFFKKIEIILFRKIKLVFKRHFYSNVDNCFLNVNFLFFDTYTSKRSQWMSENTFGWYETYAQGCPSTNNGLESTNKVIKDEGTDRDRLSLNDFMKVMKDMLQKWSLDRDAEFTTTKKFELKPIISTRGWTFGYNWVKLRKRIVKYLHGGTQFYMCTNSESTSDITKAQCKEFWIKEDDWHDLDELLEWSLKFIAVKIDSENWESSTCSCHYWQTTFKCKHTIGTSHFLNSNKFPGLDLSTKAMQNEVEKKNPDQLLKEIRLLRLTGN
ncbi:hypothetical protein BpHYR1_015168 [Brachionus plicatilis]|uniref:SWIM-type domain-containing protein n=1 Tax=Brachionus plicatilis TaxID=10195 RepID=A0A3M7RCE7_BRAPC|nr:hypothetical protein BpHYR1_015168 [Brachionus plicatilis]